VPDWKELGAGGKIARSIISNKLSTATTTTTTDAERAFCLRSSRVHSESRRRRRLPGPAKLARLSICLFN
jgi:hypothetical protein